VEFQVSRYGLAASIFNLIALQPAAEGNEPLKDYDPVIFLQ
jgi:hypothetical protein